MSKYQLKFEFLWLLKELGIITYNNEYWDDLLKIWRNK